VIPAVAPTNVPSTADAEIDWESLKDPVTGLYAGKYPTRAEAVKGMGHVVNMAKDALTGRTALEQEVTRLRTELASRQTQPSASPAVATSLATPSAASRAAAEKAQADYDAVLSEVAEDGGLLNEDAAKRLQRASREMSVAAARVAAEEVLLERESGRVKDEAEWKAVDDFMTKTYPQAAPFADEIGLFVQTNPLISKAVNALVASGDRVGATELAWVSFDRARSSGQTQATLAAAMQKEVQLGAADQVRKEAVDAARIDAGVPTSGASGVHEAKAAVASQEEINALANAMRAYGDQPGSPAAAEWRRHVIKLDPKVFGE